MTCETDRTRLTANLTRALALAFFVSGAAGLVAPGAAGADAPPAGAIVKTEFIVEHPPFASSHASTIAETRDGFVAAWFGGSEEKAPDVGIWVARHDGAAWSAPVEVANGIQPGENRRYACWNPVLFQPSKGPLLLFYKVGPSPSAWWGMLIKSADGGKTWSAPIRLAKGILGPIRNVPIEMPDGTLLSGSSTEDAGWRVHMERAKYPFENWERTEPLNTGKDFGAIQPTILAHQPDSIQILCRTRQHVISECWSSDGGKTWSPMKATTLPNPNSGIAAALLQDGRSLLVYNHTPRGRSPLNIAVSADGKLWQAAEVLEDQPGEYSYPTVIQARDGLVHVTYTWKRLLIKHVVVDPRKLALRPMPDGQWR